MFGALWIFEGLWLVQSTLSFQTSKTAGVKPSRCQDPRQVPWLAMANYGSTFDSGSPQPKLLLSPSVLKHRACA